MAETITTTLKTFPLNAPVTAVAHASGNTYNGFTTIMASAPTGLLLAGFNFTGYLDASVFWDAQWFIDIAVGAASAEVVVATIPFRNYGEGGSLKTAIVFPIPLDVVPAASRVSFRVKWFNDGSSQTVKMSMMYYEKPLSDTITTSIKAIKSVPTATERFVLSTTGVFTSGAWVELIASAAADLVLVGCQPGAGANGYVAEIDIGVGAAGSEVVKATVSDHLSTTGGGPSWLPFMCPLDVVPSGSRVAARARATNTSNAYICLSYMEKPL